jgi:arginase family enzyme
VETPAFLSAEHGLPFAGILTFDRAEHTRELDGAELVVMGVPFDSGAVNRPGARFAPRAIREQSVYAGALKPVYPWDRALDLRLVDYGDVAPLPGSHAVESLRAGPEDGLLYTYQSPRDLSTTGKT